MPPPSPGGTVGPGRVARWRHEDGRVKVSILVNNWNYADYLPVALDSALAQDHDDVELVVVDDGSTDASAEVLDRYAALAGDRMTVIRQANAGQPAAGLAGLEHSTGEIVMFLDADDYLDPSAASRVAAAWQPGCAKVQFRLSLVGPDGVRFGVDPPEGVPMPSGNMVPQLQRTGRYESPVTSGNAYPRELLEKLFPIPAAFHNIDGYLNTVTPLFGPVISLDDELGAYRQHGRNRWAFSGGIDVDRLRRRVRHDLIRERQLRATAAERGIEIPAGLPLRNPDHLLHRLASLRLEPQHHEQSDDSRLGLLRLGLGAVWHDGTSIPDRLYLTVVFLLVAGLPRTGARAVLSFAIGGSRPEWLRGIVRSVRAVLKRGSR
jgi:glycosyltransferase involved in cell wall biosynthesis